MGIRSGFRKFSRAFFNFRPDLWLDYKNLKAQTHYYYNQFRNLYQIERGTQPETFEEAEQRLNLSPEFLELQKKHYLLLIYFYLGLSACILLYCLWLIASGNWMGSLMSFAVTLYALSFAFRYHFWLYQLQKRKLSCSFNEWLLDTLKLKRFLSPKTKAIRGK